MQNQLFHLGVNGVPAAAKPISLFEQEILSGLSSFPKTLPSKYFYDHRGDALFQHIMQLPEYYLTRAELQLLKANTAKLLRLFSSPKQAFNLIELGAGDGLKTKVLLRSFCQAGAEFSYTPIDISENAVNQLSQSIKAEIPEVIINPMCLDYFQGLDQLSQQSDTRKVVLFLGSSIGNMNNTQAIAFLKELQAHLSPCDLLLIGFDLVKEPEKILSAYNDSSGITAAFNLNLLARINHETGANFELTNFGHFPVYDPQNTEARSYLISKKAQTVLFPNSGKEISFEPWEAIHTEISRKYTLADTDKIALESGFGVVAHFTDSEHQFLDALWQKE